MSTFGPDKSTTKVNLREVFLDELKVLKYPAPIRLRVSFPTKNRNVLYLHHGTDDRPTANTVSVWRENGETDEGIGRRLASAYRQECEAAAKKYAERAEKIKRDNEFQKQLIEKRTAALTKLGIVTDLSQVVVHNEHGDVLFTLRVESFDPVKGTVDLFMQGEVPLEALLNIGNISLEGAK